MLLRISIKILYFLEDTQDSTTILNYIKSMIVSTYTLKTKLSLYIKLN